MQFEARTATNEPEGMRPDSFPLRYSKRVPGSGVRDTAVGTDLQRKNLSSLVRKKMVGQLCGPALHGAHHPGMFDDEREADHVANCVARRQR